MEIVLNGRTANRRIDPHGQLHRKIPRVANRLLSRARDYAQVRARGAPETVEEVFEPYLIQIGFLNRTPQGRVATRRAWEHLGIARR